MEKLVEIVKAEIGQLKHAELKMPLAPMHEVEMHLSAYEFNFDMVGAEHEEDSIPYRTLTHGFSGTYQGSDIHGGLAQLYVRDEFNQKTSALLLAAGTIPKVPELMGSAYNTGCLITETGIVLGHLRNLENPHFAIFPLFIPPSKGIRMEHYLPNLHACEDIISAYTMVLGEKIVARQYYQFGMLIKLGIDSYTKWHGPALEQRNLF